MGGGFRGLFAKAAQGVSVWEAIIRSYAAVAVGG